MYLSGLIHRDRLFDLATRWLADHPQPADGRTVTEIFAFERAVTAPTVRRFVADLCRSLQPGDLYLERMDRKDAVREAIVSAAVHPTARVAELIDWYRQLPEEYFPRTPVHMSLVTRRNGRIAALIRRKRIRRIADKVSRRVTDRLTSEIGDVARALAASRPVRPAGPLPASHRPSGIPAGVLGAAERLVADRIRFRRIVFDPDCHRVDDVIGAKIVGSDDELARVEDVIDGLDYTWAFHREVHDGRYVGTHYVVDLELPSVDEIVAGMAGVDWSFAAGRGLPERDIQTLFRDYVASGERTFRLELILTTFEDLVESEFGTCIHEQRILDQRERASDHGRIARNASWIIEYLLSLAISPTVRVDELPIKLWGRYVRDTVAQEIARLDGRDPPEWLLPTDPPDELLSL